MRKVISFLLVLLLLGSIMVTPSVAWDSKNFKNAVGNDIIYDTEFNNSCSSAQIIKSGQTVLGTLTVPASWKDISSGSTGVDDFCDMDYFKFTLSKRSDIEIAVFPQSYCNEDYMMIALSDVNDSTIERSFSNINESPKQVCSTICATLDAGTYYITFLCRVDSTKYNGASYLGYFETYPVDSGNTISSSPTTGGNITTASLFKDYYAINPTYQNAISYMVDNGIITGYYDNTFKPNNGLTRGAASKILANLILGPSLAARIATDTAPFKDVPIENTFSGYIAYCSAEGICNGYSDGTFKASAPLTTEAFAKMLLNYANYTNDKSRYVGDFWRANVYQDALNAGIIDENANMAAPVTREYAAYMAYNSIAYSETSASTKISGATTTTSVNPSYGTSSQLPDSAVPLTKNAVAGVWKSNVYNDPDWDYEYFIMFSGDKFQRQQYSYVYEEFSKHDNNIKYIDTGTYYIDGPNIVVTYRTYSPWYGTTSDWKTETWPVAYIHPGGIRFEHGVSGYVSYYFYSDKTFFK